MLLLLLVREQRDYTHLYTGAKSHSDARIKLSPNEIEENDIFGIVKQL